MIIPRHSIVLSFGIVIRKYLFFRNPMSIFKGSIVAVALQIIAIAVHADNV